MIQASHDKILIIGGGIIGLCSAYYAAQAGYDVTVLERNAEDLESASTGNAGMIVPSHFIPLAAPGVMLQGLKWLFDSESPFSIKPLPSLSLAQWGFDFWKHANAKHTEQCKGILAELNLRSRSLYSDLQKDLSFKMHRKGLLMLCKSQSALDHEAQLIELGKELGIQAELCDPARLKSLDPDIQMNVAGAVWFKQDCHLNPEEFITALKRKLTSMGVKLCYQSEVVQFCFANNRVQSVSCKEGSSYEAEQIVIAGGAWTPELAALLKQKILIQAGKGYALTLPTPPELPSLCSICTEAKVAVTPMGKNLRFAGTMEIGSKNTAINRRKIDGITKSIPRYFPAFQDVDFSQLDIWSGLRPCSSDGLPYIDRIPHLKNALIATGHGMMGMSLGPISGVLVTELLKSNKKHAALRLSRP